MKSPKVISFRHTGIIVQDMDKAVHFYEGILGFEIIQKYNDSSQYINDVLGINQAKISMVKLKTKDGYIIELLKYINHPTEYLSAPFYNVGICHLAFTIDNADQMYKKLQKEGIEVISKPLLSSEKIAKVFFCIDPNGIRIELVEMLEN